MHKKECTVQVWTQLLIENSQIKEKPFNVIEHKNYEITYGMYFELCCK